MKSTKQAFFFLLCLLFAHLCRAAIPDDFEPLVVTPPFSFSERVLDLRPAFEKARLLSKPILIYLGAADCSPCKKYSLFLENHKKELKPALAEVVLVDIRTWLTGPKKIIIRISDKTYTVKEFQALVGDSNTFLVYPTWWLLTPEGKQIRQMPTNNSDFFTVESHIKIIRKADVGS